MQQINFADAKKKIEEIVKIVETVPEPLRETCFKMLFDLSFSRSPAVRATSVAASEEPAADERPNQTTAETPRSAPTNGFRLQPNMLAFSRKYQISPDLLQKLFILDHEPLLPIYKISTNVTRTAQLQKVLMILLENGLLNNAFKAPYAELREAVNEVGLLDSNFNKTLKKNHELFKGGAITADKIVDTQSIELTGAGYEELAKVVRELAEAAA